MSVSKRLRFEIFRRDHHACRYCGATASDTPLTIDHVMPASLGGTDEPDNLVTACQDCNSGKTSSMPDASYVADVAADVLRRARVLMANKHETEHLADRLLGHLDIRDYEHARQIAKATRVRYQDDDEQPILTTVEWAVLGAVSNIVDKASTLERAVRSLLRQLPAVDVEDLRRSAAADLTASFGNEWSDNDLLEQMIRSLHVVAIRSSSDPQVVN